MAIGNYKQAFQRAKRVGGNYLSIIASPADLHPKRVPSRMRVVAVSDRIFSRNGTSTFYFGIGMNPIIFQKQAEYFDGLHGILDKINGYISMIDVWSVEKTRGAKRKIKMAARNNGSLLEFSRLHDRYSIYLPLGLLQKADDLHLECTHLGHNPSSHRSEKCMDSFFKFKVGVRQFIGIDNMAWKLRAK